MRRTMADVFAQMLIVAVLCGVVTSRRLLDYDDERKKLVWRTWNMTLREDSDVTKGRQMGQLSPGATAEGVQNSLTKNI